MKRAETIKEMIKKEDKARASNIGNPPAMESINALLLINATSASLREGIKLLAQAVSKDNDEEHREALKLYTTAMEKIMGGLPSEKNMNAKGVIMGQLDSFLDRAEALKKAGFK